MKISLPIAWILLFVPTLLGDVPTTTAPRSAEPLRPNILLFYVDDMGWGSVGPNGQASRRAEGLPSVRTPNLDRLAAEGLNFTRGYGCHVCSPARSSLQTGFHQGHTFADRNDPDNAKKAIRADDVSIGKALSSVGYATGYWGKWGYGASKDQIDPVIQNVQTLPTSHGFEHVLAELHHVRAHTFFQPTLWSAPSQSKGGLELVPNSMARFRDENWPKLPARQHHAKYPSTAYCDDAYAFAALDFVRNQGQAYNKTGQPFVGLLAVQIPHAPFAEIATLPEWNRAYADDPHFSSLAPQSQQWAAMITRIDAHFGNILAALEDPNNDGDTSDSIAKDTLVIFKSDNGGPAGKSNVELNANGGLRGNKGKIQEGGIRVPFIVRWPATITDKSALKAGSHCDKVVDVTDMLPTFCELAGATVPVGVDGVSLAPMLSGRGHQREREFIIHEASNGQSVIRDEFKLVRPKRGPLQLFNLAQDHSEEHDISKEHPELVKQLEGTMLNERVLEPKGFANTYHRWTGGQIAAGNVESRQTSKARNWSDYTYANAGITYMQEDGAPQASWIARMENSSDVDNVAQVDADLEVLALEVKGNSDKKRKQSLLLVEGISVTGRNEIRLAAHSELHLNGGGVSSARWIDVFSEAKLIGYGTVAADLYNNGIVDLKNENSVGSANPVLTVTDDYHQGSEGTLRISRASKDIVGLSVEGSASLGGKLELGTIKGSVPQGTVVTILKAKQIAGQFSNSEVRSEDGKQFAIEYEKTAVRIRAK